MALSRPCQLLTLGPLFLLLFSSSSSFLLPAFSLSDSEALLKLKQSITNATALDSWVPGSPPCNANNGAAWAGLLCYKGIVTGLRLEGMGLSGNLDIEALAGMKTLRSFSVINNSFAGAIPQVNRLGALKALFMSGNQFSGEIPPDFFAKMDSLKKVWLSNNNFTGTIPSSLGHLSYLMDLHLENNHFTGNIPAFNNSSSLKSINLSNNKLVGPIPPGLSKFKASSFAGNPGLCGLQVNVGCNLSPKPANPTPNNTPSSSKSGNAKGRNSDYRKIIAAFITLGLLLLSVILICAIRWRKKKKDNAARVRRSSNEAAVEIQVTVPPRRDHVAEVDGAVRRNTSSGRRGSRAGGGAAPELIMVNDERGVFGLPDLMKASAEVLGNGVLGSSYKAVMANGVPVVAKRTREMNALGKDAFDAHVKRLGKLRHPNVLTPLAYHYRRDEKLFVSEFLPNGSLLYLLHGDDGTVRPPLDWPTRLKLVRGIAQGLGYLHTELAYYDVPHGNLKSSNVLLGPDNHPFLTEFGFWPLLNSNGLNTMFAYKAPEATQHGTVTHKSDVYCLGILILEILSGKFPSHYLPDENLGGTDLVQWVMTAFSEGKQAEMLDPEIAGGCQRSVLGSMEKLLHIALLCVQTNPEQRLHMKEAVRMIGEVQVDSG